MFADRRLAIVTGKGGVGRSAVAAGLAIAAAERGVSTLVLAMGEPTGLATHLGIPALDTEPTVVSPDLAAARIQPANALDEYVRLQLPRVPTRLAGRIFGALAENVPGIRDVVVIGKCIHEARSGGWDLVVVDGLPTGQIDSVLTAPSVIAGLVGRGPVHEQATHLATDLADPEFAVVIPVTTPEALAISEITELADDLDGIADMAPPILNGLLPEPPAEPPPDTSAARAIAALATATASTQRTVANRVDPSATIPHLLGAGNPQAVAETMAGVLA